MAVGMAELLRILPEDNPDRKAIMQGYLKMMVRLKEMQDQKGMWKQVVDDASMWEETSGTGMFAYAMIVGVKKDGSIKTSMVLLPARHGLHLLLM